MKEGLRSTGLETTDVEQRETTRLMRSAKAAWLAAHIADFLLGKGLAPDGHELLKELVLKTWKGERVSVARDVSRIYLDADLKIEVEGEKYIPVFGSTIFVVNHTYGGPMRNMAQFMEIVKVGHDMRSEVQDDEVREPYLIVQKGLKLIWPLSKATATFYEIVGRSLGCELVEIPKFKLDKESNAVRIVNYQGLAQSALDRISVGGAGVWAPQGTERDPDDFNYPQEKSDRFLAKIYRQISDVQLEPIKSIPDSRNNIKVVFGPPVDIGEVIKRGGIDYFVQNHVIPLE